MTIAAALIKIAVAVAFLVAAFFTLLGAIAWGCHRLVRRSLG